MVALGSRVCLTRLMKEVRAIKKGEPSTDSGVTKELKLYQGLVGGGCVGTIAVKGATIMVVSWVVWRQFLRRANYLSLVRA